MRILTKGYSPILPEKGDARIHDYDDHGAATEENITDLVRNTMAHIAITTEPDENGYVKILTDGWYDAMILDESPTEFAERMMAQATRELNR